jgi:hypothetical protein
MHFVSIPIHIIIGKDLFKVGEMGGVGEQTRDI